MWCVFVWICTCTSGMCLLGASMSEPHIDRLVEVRLTVCPCVCLSGWNIMGMCGERNTRLSCTVLLRMLNVTPPEWNMREKSSGRKQTTRISRAWTWQRTSKTEKIAARRAREGSEQRARRLEGSKRRRQQRNARTRDSEKFNKNANKMGMNSSAWIGQ